MHPVVKKVAGTALIAYLTIRIVGAIANSLKKSTNATAVKAGNLLTG